MIAARRNFSLNRAAHVAYSNNGVQVPIIGANSPSRRQSPYRQNSPGRRQRRTSRALSIAKETESITSCLPFPVTRVPKLARDEKHSFDIVN